MTKMAMEMTMMTITCSTSMRSRGVFLPRRRMCAATVDLRCRGGQHDDDEVDVDDDDEYDVDDNDDVDDVDGCEVHNECRVG